MTSNTEMTQNLLVLEEDPNDARRIQNHLQDATQGQFVCTCVLTVGEVVEQLHNTQFDVILLNLDLADRQGLETFLNVQAQARTTPILLLTKQDDQTLAAQLLRAGAQDCLLKQDATGNTLQRAIRYAIERQQLQTELQNNSLNDNLTGLYNRRGFFVLASEHLKLLHRSPHGLLLFLCDVNKMKAINNTFGHNRGDQTLVDCANILRETFRSSDVIARVGGDEFAILAIGTIPSTAEMLQARLQVQLNRHNAQSKRPYQLSFSSGISYVGPEDSVTAEQLIARATQALSEQKQSEQKS